MPDEPQQPIQIINHVSPTPIENIVQAPAVTVIPTDDTQAKRANSISRLALIVNFILSLLTLAAIAVSWYALDYTKNKDSKDYADRKTAEQIADRDKQIADSINRHRDSITFSNNSKSLGLAQRTLESQIRVLNESQRNFILSHRPIITISQVVYDTSIALQQTSITMVLSNSGTFSAYIPMLTSAFGWAPIDSLEYAVKTLADAVNLKPNLTLAYDIKMTQHIAGPPMSAEQFALFKQGKVVIFFRTEIGYVNLQTKEKYEQRAVFRIDWVPNGISVEGMEFSDKPVKKFSH